MNSNTVYSFEFAQSYFRPTEIQYWFAQSWIRQLSNVLTYFFIYISIFTMVTYFLRWTLLKFFSSFPDEQSQQKNRQLDRITAQWLIHQMKLRARYCGNFEFIIFLWEFKKGSLVGSIVNIRNECLFFWVHGEWIVARNKQIGQEPLRGSRDLFVPRYNSFPMNPEKKTLIP